MAAQNRKIRFGSLFHAHGGKCAQLNGEEKKFAQFTDAQSIDESGCSS